MKISIKRVVLIATIWFGMESQLFAQTEIAIPNSDNSNVAVFRHNREEHFFYTETGEIVLGIGENGAIVIPNIEYEGNIDGLEGEFTVYGYSGTVELIVDISEFPDYVFNDDYQLISLEETEMYIDQNGHLPGIPAADQFENGMEMKKFDLKLLEKIEELTLYTIAQQKRLEAIHAKLNELTIEK